jgi:hypothetical protein
LAESAKRQAENTAKQLGIAEQQVTATQNQVDAIKDKCRSTDALGYMSKETMSLVLGPITVRSPSISLWLTGGKLLLETFTRILLLKKFLMENTRISITLDALAAHLKPDL